MHLPEAAPRRHLPVQCVAPRPRAARAPPAHRRPLSADYTAATFGHEAARPRSVVTVAVFDAARRAVHAALDISMFVRTRKPSGQIFYLGSPPRCPARPGPPSLGPGVALQRRRRHCRYGHTDETLVGASLKGGELLVHLRFNQTPEDYTVGGTRLDNGHLHLIEVVIASSAVGVVTVRLQITDRWCRWCETRLWCK